MCRFVLYQGAPITLSTLIAEPVNSLISQAIHSREQADPVNADGFGFAWYVPEISREPALFRSVIPAWNDRNLRELARVTRSGCILAHVRRASPNLHTTELNCHPFVSGRFAFMHNGDLPGFPRIKRLIQQNLSDEAFQVIQGNTDSEQIFAVFLDQLRKCNSGASHRDSTADILAQALSDSIFYLVELCRQAGVEQANTYLNIAVSDGRCSAISRFSTAPPAETLSLHYHTGKRYVCENHICRMIEPDEGQGAVVVSSEALSDDPGWAKIHNNHMLVIHADRKVELRPIH